MPLPRPVLMAQGRIALGAILLATPVLAVPIQNPNFDLPIVQPGRDYDHFDTGYNPAPSAFGWTLVSGTIELVDGYYWVGPNGAGDQSLDLNGNGSGHIAQSVLLERGTYSLQFALAANPDGGHVKSLRASLGSNSSDFAFDSSTHTKLDMGWEMAEAIFRIPTAGTYTLGFESLTAGPWGVAIDSVSLARVPETFGGMGTTWLAGFSLLSAAWLRFKGRS